MVNFNFNKDYCQNCIVRVNNPGKPDSKGANCPAGRKNNPSSLEATLHVIKNGGEVCSFNPARQHFGRTELAEMAVTRGWQV